MKRTILLLLLALSCPISLAGNLTGVRRIDIAIEDLDADSAVCQITKESIDTVIRFVLQQSKLRIVSDPATFDGFIYIAVTTNQERGLYFSSVVTQFNTVITGKTRYGTGMYPGTLFSRNSLLSGASGTFGNRITRSVEDSVKKFVVEWAKDNP